VGNSRRTTERCSTRGCRCLALDDGLCRSCIASQEWKPPPVTLPPSLQWLDLDRLADTEPPAGWKQYAACGTLGTDGFYLEVGDPAAARKARTLCAGCPVLYACLSTALTTHSTTTDHGIWGRTSVQERRKIRRALHARDLAA